MDNKIILEKIKRRSTAAINQSDELLNDLIEETHSEILEYINQNKIQQGLEGSLIEIVIIKCNKLGSEGLSSENFSGISQSYINDYPRDIIKKLNRYRKLPR